MAHRAASFAAAEVKSAREAGIFHLLDLAALNEDGITAHAGAFSPAPRLKVLSTAGAGDSLLGGFVAGFAIGMPFISKTLIRDARIRRIASALQLGVPPACDTELCANSAHENRD